MRYRITQSLTHAILIAAVLALVIAPGTQSASAETSVSEMPYRLVPGMTSSSGVDIRSLSASSSIIAWEDHRSGESDIYVYDITDGRETRAVNLEAIRREPSVSGSTIIWIEGDASDDGVIRGVDLTEAAELEITSEPARISRPTISSDLIAWQERVDGRWLVQVADRSGERLGTLGEDAQNAGRPDASGHRLVWQQHDGESWNIHLYDAEVHATAPITGSEHDDQYPVVSDEYIVFLRSPASGGPPQLIARHIESGEEQVITSDHTVQRPAISGQMVVWEDWRSGLPDIYAWDLNQQRMFAVARSQQANAPVVSGSVVAWISGNDPQSQRIQAMQIQERLPTDPHDPPAVPSPESLYISETQHFVSSGFKAFWQANGGPQVLGYPLSEEFRETDPDSGEELIVQYFERVRLEYHPDAPEDQRIRLALLGHELRPDAETAPIDPFESSEEQIYFPETGHAISYGFKDFWENNGGLELFGFPITGEFLENGRVVQYFERARFEYNPESPLNQVSLGLLGRESLQQRGWLPPPPVDTTQIFE
jgi:beta propeller repeat protein